MAFKMRGFSGFKQKKETETKQTSKSSEATADPNAPSVQAELDIAEYEKARKAELARLSSKESPNPHSPHIYYYESGREETQISDDPSEWGWENEPEYITKRTIVHGGHEDEKVINPWGPLATSDKPKVEGFEKALGMTSRLTNPTSDWRSRAYLRHEGKE